MTQPLLDIAGLAVSYGTTNRRVPAVRNVSFAIAPGEAYGLIGESGSGKTTIAFAVMGHLNGGRVDAGRILFRDRDILALSPQELASLRGRSIAMVYQDPLSSLNPTLRVGEQVAEGIRHHRGLSHRAAAAEAASLLDQVHLPDPARLMLRYPHELSGGQQQRVVIAMALACRPQLLIMDEPTTGLDVTTEAVILDLVAELRSALGVAILFISHNLGVVRRVCDRIGVLYAGELMEEGRTEKVLQRPRHPYTRSLLRSIPEIGRRSERLASIAGSLPDLTSLPSGCIFHPRCPEARDICASAAPPVEEVEPGHISRCHFARDLPDALAEDTASASMKDLPEGRKPLLRVVDLEMHYVRSRRFGPFGRTIRVPALSGVGIEVAAGETLAIVGESGSGKSTLARCIVGLAAPTGGSIEFEGTPLTATRPRATRRDIQIIFQNPEAALNPFHTVAEIIARPLRLYGLREGPAIRQRVIELLDAVKLGERFSTHYPRELSGGEKQRVSIARAFAAEPRLVICDEPTSALDISVQAALLNELKELQRRYGTSYLFISHDLSVVRHIAERVAVMYLGLILETGPTAEVFQPPHHPYTEALISAVPTVSPVDRGPVLRLQGSVPDPANPPAGCVFHTRCPRKLGRVCETDAPPWRHTSAGRAYACHIPPEDLLALQQQPTTETDRPLPEMEEPHER